MGYEMGDARYRMLTLGLAVLRTQSVGIEDDYDD